MRSMNVGGTDRAIGRHLGPLNGATTDNRGPSTSRAMNRVITDSEIPQRNHPAGGAKEGPR
jgi:hypothetical protein